MNRRLFLFTGQYPYSKYVECFLEDEILHLSSYFEEVIIIPTRKDEYLREIPQNCTVTQDIFQNKISFMLKGLFNKRSFSFLWKDFFENRVYSCRKKFLVWLKCYYVTNNYLNSKVVKDIEKSICSSDVCYSYWGKWSNVLSLFWSNKCHFVSRFHGAWDLWEEDFDDYAPLRQQVVNHLEKAYFISKKGADYFKVKYPHANTQICRLGSRDFGNKNRTLGCVVKIVSCSTIYPLKRIPLIYKTVCLFAKRNSEKKVEWTHIGGGPNYSELELLTKGHNCINLHINLVGLCNHDEVIEFYKKNDYSVFINLSTNEGVPVSIMEAISFNIPVIGTDVGGTSEIVTSLTGQLVSSDPSESEVAEAIEFLQTAGICPREFWMKYYNASTNYSSFAKELATL